MLTSASCVRHKLYKSAALMNRKKKRNAILKRRLKKAKAKLAPKSKSTYVSKADRETLALEEQAKSADEAIE